MGIMDKKELTKLFVRIYNFIEQRLGQEINVKDFDVFNDIDDSTKWAIIRKFMIIYYDNKDKDIDWWKKLFRTTLDNLLGGVEDERR
jgi:hypothetical protein